MTTFKYTRAEDFAGDGRRFQRTDLSTAAAETPELLLGIVYRGFSTTVFGPTGSAKTLLAHALTLEAKRAGLEVSLWDEELGVGPTAARLVALGATADELAGLAYYDWQAPGLEDSDAFAAEMYGQDIVVLDPVSDMLVAAGVDENANAEFTEWAMKFPQRLTHAGVASILIDGSPHSDGRDGKSREGRQRGATQKGYKASLVWRVDVIDEPTKEHVGLVRLTCTKDRFGDVGRGASLTFALGGDGNGRIVFERRDSMAQPAQEERVAENRREWVIRVAEVLAQHAPSHDEAITQTQLVGMLPPGRLAFKREMCQLAATSVLTPVHSRPGARDSILYWHAVTESHRVPPSPEATGHSGPDGTPTGSHRVPPYIGTRSPDSVVGLGEPAREGTTESGTRDPVVPARTNGVSGVQKFLDEVGTDAAWRRVARKADDEASA